MSKNSLTNSVQETEVSNARPLRRANKTGCDRVGAANDTRCPSNCKVINFERASLDLWTTIVKKVGRCQLCGCFWMTLHAHHMIRKTGNGIKYSRDINNGICLCEACHKKAHPGWSRFNNSGLAVHELHERIKERCPKKYAWLMVHKDDKRFVQLDYEKIYYELKKLTN